MATVVRYDFDLHVTHIAVTFDGTDETDSVIEESSVVGSVPRFASFHGAMEQLLDTLLRGYNYKKGFMQRLGEDLRQSPPYIIEHRFLVEGSTTEYSDDDTSDTKRVEQTLRNRLGDQPWWE